MVNLLSLLQLSDPALPIGGFSHSAGLETYVQAEIVNSKSTAVEFVTTQLSHSILYTDAAFVSLAYDAAEKNNLQLLFSLDEECTAVKMPKEMRQASHKLGLRLLKIFGAACKHPLMEKYKKAIDDNEADGHYSIAFALAGYALSVSKKELLTGFFYTTAAGMVTNCVKLIPLGQQDGQQILFSLHHFIEELVTKAINPNPDFIGLCCTGFDIRCMQHEQLYSRLYMS